MTYREQEGWLSKKYSGNRARTIYQDDEGNLWFGNDFGISLLINNRFINYILRRDSVLVTGIVRDNHGDLWVGLFEGGIVRFSVKDEKTGRPRLTETAQYPKIDGLADDNIRAVFKDEHGNLWFATDHGADCLSMGEHGIATFRHFTMQEGLAGDGVRALYQDAQGKLWLGTDNGVTCYDPTKATPDALPPPVYITQFQIFGKPDTTALRKMRTDLAYNQHSVAFEYIGLSFKDETKVRYQHKLEGFDTEWSAETDRRYVSYTHLPSGEYVFKVEARNAGGVWSETPATFEFHIATPYWRTWWFISLVVIGIIGMIIGIHQVRVRRLVAMERMRSRIATDLHDDLGSTLSSISIFSEMAQREIKTAAPGAMPMLQRIGESSRAMLEAIVWAINPENDALDNVILRMREFATALFEASGIAFALNFPENTHHLKLPMEVRRDFYLIFKEAVNNIVKHSHCRQAMISLATDEQHLILTINDDGRGFNRKLSFSGNGLKNIEKRTKAIGGAVKITSHANCDHLVEHLEQATPDVVLMDIGLPGISGIEGVNIIKSYFPKLLMPVWAPDNDEN